ncbi:hypothetical protein L2E82_31978 [Cichorium intybus]|uniref:Uncharacterized protein n=1 Tax=Cichorium intybus TaxID=13427 RepID=A0ACB9BHE9_CICIN|nr:hypothetical protein L2E82_31978 [Cichorium intybus]
MPLNDATVVEDGYEFFANRQLVAVFSAPNYCGEFDNAGAMMSVDETLMWSFQILKPVEKKNKFNSGISLFGSTTTSNLEIPQLESSQFGDTYQEDYFIKTLKDEVNIAKNLPSHLDSLDVKELGTLITDADLTKEATPIEYINKILLILSKKNGVVHLFGYGDRLGFILYLRFLLIIDSSGASRKI